MTVAELTDEQREKILAQALKQREARRAYNTKRWSAIKDDPEKKAAFYEKQKQYRRPTRVADLKRTIAELEAALAEKRAK